MRDSWNSKLGFLIAAIGSAVGLGNLWRFPYTAATHGGGAFLLPYFIAIITSGIPILILEYTMGKKYKAGAPVALARINRKFEWLGWLQIMVCFLILMYYVAIVVWTVSYVGFSFSLSWGDDPTGFFLQYLGLSAGPLEFGGIQVGLLLPFLAIWIIASIIMYRGISKGVEVICRICLPVLMVLTCVLVIRGITLPGATAGLEYMFKPDWSALTDYTVWVAAYGQIFYSLSIAFGIMVSYSSYLPEKTDVVNSAFITATANHGFEIFAGIGVFSIIGYMAYSQGVSVEEVAGQGVGLAFMTFPTAISSLPALNSIVGVCFFGALLTAGISSFVSISQAIVTGVEDKFNISHKKAVTMVMVPSFILSFLFVTGAGLHILDIVDAFVNQVGIAFCGVIEVFLIGWFFKTEKLREEANSYSNFSVGRWWTWCIKFVTVIILGIMTILNTKEYIMNGYGGYEQNAVNIFGWGAIAIIVVGAIILTSMKGKDKYWELKQTAKKEGK